MSNWPFLDVENTAVFTTKSILSKDKPILYVSHNEEDGAWQFHTNEELEDDDPKVVALHRIFALDRTVGVLADLPLGWSAARETRDTPWQRFENATS